MLEHRLSSFKQLKRDQNRSGSSRPLQPGDYSRFCRKMQDLSRKFRESVNYKRDAYMQCSRFFQSEVASLRTILNNWFQPEEFSLRNWNDNQLSLMTSCQYVLLHYSWSLKFPCKASNLSICSSVEKASLVCKNVKQHVYLISLSWAGF